MTMTPHRPTFIKRLPDEETVELSVEQVTKKDETDEVFALECRVLTGSEKGELISLLFFRKKKSGEPRKDTAKLLSALAPGYKGTVPSYMLLGKIFACKPWQPDSYKHQMYSDFRLIGSNDVL